MPHLVDILLTTFNGDKYLHAQIQSLLAQQFTDWHLIVRDDGSKDNTLLVLKDYQSAHPLKISILKDSLGRLGPAQSFAYLAQHSSASYVAFCDQDDIWLQDKLFLQVDAMQNAEKEYGKFLPILVHSDLLVVDKDLNLVGTSFWDYQNLKPRIMKKLNRLLVQNYVTGCTILINKPLVDLALPIPAGARMHDWWLALMAISEGKVISLSDKTVKYRGHDSNNIGAKKWNFLYIIGLALHGQKSIKLSIIKTRDQAVALLESGKLNDTSKKVVTRYIEMFELNWFSRRILMVRMGFFKFGVVRNLAIFVFI